MSKIIATLTVLSLFVSVAYSATTTQSGSFSSNDLNSSATKVYGANSTGADTTWITIPYNQITFGPATTNATLFAYGIVFAASGSVTVYKRTINATIVGYGNDTTETNYIASDATITATAGNGNIGTTAGTAFATAVGPGYLAILAVNIDSLPVSQVYLIIVTGTSATVKTITANTVALGIAYTISASGSIFYDAGSTAFFYTYLGSVLTTSGGSTYTATINAGGYYAGNTTSFFTANSYSITAGTAYTSATKVTTPIIGPDNFTSATNIIVAYKDTTAAITYFSKTSKVTTTTALVAGSSLVADSTAAANMTTYVPIGVWASNYTYGISTSLTAVTTSPAATTYTIANFYNGSTTGYLSGIELSGATGAAVGVWGWQLNTGYTLVGKWPSSSTNAYTYTLGVFLSNATANTTSTIVATLATGVYGPVTTFEDANGELWLGWTDVTYTTSGSTNTPTTTLIGYLAGLQGSLNPASSTFANALKGIMAFVAFCLAAVFAF